MPSQLYRMFDPEPRGVMEITPGESAGDWNRKGFGIFWTVNEFQGARRIENLTRIRSWAIDMDDGTKAEMVAKLNSSPLVPSLVVETRRGYQAYWNAKDAKPEHWNAIVLERLVHYFGADKNARDLARILRVPGYLHQKDPKSPFMVKTVHTHEVAYTERQIVAAFPAVQAEVKNVTRHQEARKQFPGNDDFWERVWHLDHEEALTRIGSVIGESYSFRGMRNGNRNIYVDGKGTSCWIDKHGRIGSLSKGGPTIFQWLKWLGHSDRAAIDMIKQTFPELTR